jgi:cytochrome P450
MPRLDEMNLPVLPLEDIDFSTNPFPQAAEARKIHPWLGKFSQGYVVYGYHAARDLAMMDDAVQMSFSGLLHFYQAHETPWAKFMEEMLLTSAGSRHKRLRDSVAAGFTPRRANQIRPMIQRIIADLLDDWVPRGAFDFAEFAANYPIAVMCGLLGISSEPIPRVRSALDAHMASLTYDPSLGDSFTKGYEQIWQFADDLIVEREKRGLLEDGAELDTMIAARNAGLLDETELRFMLMTFLLAGYDTSKNMLAVTMLTMLERPEMWARCAQDPAYARRVVEEMLRYCSIAILFRETVAEFEYDGIRFPKGITLAFAFPLTGRDPSVFANPDIFDPQRDDANRHQAFGRGIHMCIGQYIARVLMEEGIHAMAQRIIAPRLTGKPVWKPMLGAWGLETLPIAFDPG